MIVWLLYFLLITSSSALKIIYPQELQGEILSPNFKYFGVQEYNVTGPLILADNFYACEELKNDVRGRIVIVQTGTRDYEEHPFEIKC
jgi:hypothetical protein